jgi:hypothetical protein
VPADDEVPADDVDDDVDEGDDGSGATAQPDGSATGDVCTGSVADGDSGTIGSYVDIFSSTVDAMGATDSGSAAGCPLDSRLKNAVTSPPVDTMLTTDQPSADFSLSFVASADGSYDDELTVVNSCMGRDGIPGVKQRGPRRQRLGHVGNTKW